MRARSYLAYRASPGTEVVRLLITRWRRYSPFRSRTRALGIARLTMHHGAVLGDTNKKPVNSLIWKIGLDRASIVGKLKPTYGGHIGVTTWGVQWRHREENENSDIFYLTLTNEMCWLETNEMTKFSPSLFWCHWNFQYGRRWSIQYGRRWQQ